jgi:hypothetical protein
MDQPQHLEGPGLGDQPTLLNQIKFGLARFSTLGNNLIIYPDQLLLYHFFHVLCVSLQHRYSGPSDSCHVTMQKLT